MTQSQEKLGSKARWVIGLGTVLVLCLIAFALLLQPIRAMRKARELRSPMTRQKALESLKSMGLAGRMALLGAARSDDSQASAYAQYHLCEILREDIEAGRDIGPVVRRAIKGVGIPGEAGWRSAAIASEGWALGLLDEETKREIIRHFVGITVKARPEYPAGMGRPCVKPWFEEPLATALSFKYRCVGVLDGREERETDVLPWNSIASANFHDITAKPGRHTLQGRIEIELTGIDMAGPFQPPDDIGWETTFESEIVEINVRDDLPDDYLQAKVTPELEKRVADSVRAENRNWNLAFRATTVSTGRYCVRAVPPLPCDLAYRDRWELVGTDKTFEGFGGVLCKGAEKGPILQVTQDMVKHLEPGEHRLTFKVVLEPSLEHALQDPRVQAYWPRPIELPEFEIKLKILEKWLTGEDSVPPVHK